MNKLQPWQIELNERDGKHFLEETIEFLKDAGKSPEDVLCVIAHDCYCSWDKFCELADFKYDNGFGDVEINLLLKIVGDDWWLERNHTDGSEWWEFKQYPKIDRSAMREITKSDIRD